MAAGGAGPGGSTGGRRRGCPRGSGGADSPRTSSARARHVGAKWMQCPHQEAKNSTAHALGEPSSRRSAVSAPSSSSGSLGEYSERDRAAGSAAASSASTAGHQRHRGAAPPPPPPPPPPLRARRRHIARPAAPRSRRRPPLGPPARTAPGGRDREGGAKAAATTAPPVGRAPLAAGAVGAVGGAAQLETPLSVPVRPFGRAEPRRSAPRGPQLHPAWGAVLRLPGGPNRSPWRGCDPRPRNSQLTPIAAARPPAPHSDGGGAPTPAPGSARPACWAGGPSGPGEEEGAPKGQRSLQTHRTKL